ncbi:MAG TPA: hypothetical protein VMV92_01200 [Streptosporangiaceae bacterium]|nr:hypothetical protein [Streptosporangiaceae bacterium]
MIRPDRYRAATLLPPSQPYPELLTDAPLGEELASRYRGIRDTGHRVLAATTTDGSTVFRGLIAELAKSKCGLVLEPATAADGGPLVPRLPVPVLAGGLRLRAVLVRNGLVAPVQVPTLTSPPAGPALPGTDWVGAGAEGERGSAAR